MKELRIYGHQVVDDGDNGAQMAPIQLNEISLLASPAVLREIADFMVKQAAEMEIMGDDFDHVHWCDQRKNQSGDLPDIILLNAQKY